MCYTFLDTCMNCILGHIHTLCKLLYTHCRANNRTCSIIALRTISLTQKTRDRASIIRTV